MCACVCACVCVCVHHGLRSPCSAQLPFPSCPHLQGFRYPRPASLPPSSAPPSDTEEEGEEEEEGDGENSSIPISPASELYSEIERVRMKDSDD